MNSIKNKYNCKCEHALRDHQSKSINYTKYYNECLWEECECKKFIDNETNMPHTVKKTKLKDTYKSLLKIGTLDETGKIDREKSYCKNCNTNISNWKFFEHQKRCKQLKKQLA